MRFEHVAALLVIIFLLLAVPNVSGWEKNKGTGYIWEMNVAQDLKNANYTGVARGVRVYALYIQYSGMSGNLYNFSFMGSFYSSTYLNGKLEIRDASNTITYKNIVSQKWINYDGYFLLEKYKYNNDSSEQEFYGIKRVFMHIHTVEPQINSGKLKYRWMPGGTMLQSFNYTLQYNASLTVNYSRPIPYIPISGNKVSYYTSAHLYGNVNVSGTGYSKTENYTQDLNKSVTQSFSNNIQFKIEMQLQNGTVKRSAILELLPIRIAMTDLGIINYGNQTFTNSVLFASMISNNAILGKDGFYKSVTLTKYSFGVESYKSKSVTKSRVESVRSYAPAIYGKITEYENPVLITAVPIALAALMLLASVEARRHKGTK